MRVTKNIFEPKSSRVIRILLSNPGKSWTLRELAGEAGISLGYTHAVCSALINGGYLVRNETNQLTVVDPLTLLRRWAAYHQYSTANTFLDYYSFEREVDRLIEGFGKTRGRYALTGLSGAWLVAPHVRPVIVEAYVKGKEDAGAIADLLRLKPIPKNGNVRFVLPYDEGVFYRAQSIKGVKVVSNTQLYVDLFNNPARGEEASQAVLDFIRNSWSRVLLGGSSNV
ncbi:MAG: hypothetical protein JRN68_01705 [Nitrososphaerota archaeon]|jgi:hypothetical protein|nr:hypothetical protein [Nitrososphaerota archaeon]